MTKRVCGCISGLAAGMVPSHDGSCPPLRDGPWPSIDVSLKEARQAAEAWRAVARQGIDPIKEREKRRREAHRNLQCLADIALDAFETRKAELKGNGKSGRWFSPLELHILPKLGKAPVSNVSQIDIRDALRPIWHSKGETARRLTTTLVSYPKGNPMSGQTWPELRFKSMLRHIHRQQRLWSGLLDQQPGAEVLRRDVEKQIAELLSGNQT